jgi:hypothetical protein
MVLFNLRNGIKKEIYFMNLLFSIETDISWRHAMRIHSIVLNMFTLNKVYKLYYLYIYIYIHILLS